MIDPMTILWGILILAGLGLVLGFLLALAAKFLHPASGVETEIRTASPEWAAL